MATKLVVTEFKYPKTVMEIVAEDSRHLLIAMKKKYPNCHFTTLIKNEKGDVRNLVLEVVNANDFQRVSMTYFAEGFMASAHLWER